VAITIDNPATQTLDEIMGLVNSSGAGVTMEYDSANDRFVIYRPDAGNTSPITVGAAGDTSNFFAALGLQQIGGAVQFAGTAAGTVTASSALAYSNLSIPAVSGTFTINGIKITVNVGADSLEDIIKRINDSSAGVTASYDTTQDRLVLNQDLNEPPLYDRILIGSATDTSNFWSAMRLTDSYQTPQYIGTSRSKAQFVVDGQSYTRDSNTVNDVLDGITLNLKGVSPDPIAVDVTSDTTRANQAIRDFVVTYNQLIDLTNVPPLTDDERAKLTTLTDSQRSKMTFTEIDDYEKERKDLWVQEMLYRSPILSRLDNSVRLNLFSPVQGVSSGDLKVLSDLGITTGQVGLGVELAKTAHLVDDTTDPDKILQKLQDNMTLQTALEDRPDQVFNLFATDMTSTVQAVGDIDVSSGVTLATPLSFSVGNGVTQATLTLSAGYHAASSIISDITNHLSQVGLSGEVRAYLTDGGFLQLVASTSSGRARISIQELSGGGSLANVLGIGSQTTTGQDASLNAGLSRRLDTFLDGYSGSQGIINEKIKLGGLIDQQLVRFGNQITDYEYRLSLYETRLRSQFAAMEVALAQFQQTSQFLTARLGAASTGTSSSSGIQISV
jgi:flagellar hook-associated protein 2